MSDPVSNSSSGDPQWQRIEPPREGGAVSFRMQLTIRFASGESFDVTETGLLLRYAGELRAWRNHCPHAGTELDWEQGRFFDQSGEHLVCQTHDALFDPLSGECLSGPCPRGLYPLALKLCDGEVWVPTRIVPTDAL